jgi:hypothetical protein
MKRKQQVLEAVEAIDNSLISLYQALQVPGVSKEKVEEYLGHVRNGVKHIEHLVRLEND